MAAENERASASALDEDRLREAGLNSSKAKDLVARAAQAVDDANLPGAQLAVARDGEVVFEVSLGGAQPGERFVIFSATKAVVAAAMWRLFGDGALGPETRAADLLEGFGANGKHDVTVLHLLTHTGGFPQAPMGPADWGTREGRLARMASWRAQYEPGTRYEYHPTAGHWVLGALIEELTGRSLPYALRELVLDPLGLEDVRIGSVGDLPATARPVHNIGTRPTPAQMEEAFGIALDLEELIGEVTDEARVMVSEQPVLDIGIPGGGGVATAGALALLYQAMLRNPDTLWDPIWLFEGTAAVHCALPEPIMGHPSNRTLGLILAGDDGLGHLRGFGRTNSAAAFGHNGAGGQIAWADPATGLSFVFLTDGHDRDLLREWRRCAALSSRAAALSVEG